MPGLTGLAYTYNLVNNNKSLDTKAKVVPVL